MGSFLYGGLNDRSDRTFHPSSLTNEPDRDRHVKEGRERSYRNRF
ncbi:MAG TPA: hypothetical protein V6C50_08480 [Crinalium sp.]